MSSLASLVSSGGSISQGDTDGADVLALQLALSQAGYRVGQDGLFGPRTKQVVEQFQIQHGLRADGIVGTLTAALLDQPHEILVATATPLTVPASNAQIARGVDVAWPHDDTTSLIAFYEKPWENDALLTHVPCPWALLYEGQPWSHPIPFHVKGAGALKSALDAIGEMANTDASILNHVRNYSGSYNYRAIRGSSRLSVHSFGAFFRCILSVPRSILMQSVCRSAIVWLLPKCLKVW